MNKDCMLIDLERTLRTGVVHYWNQNQYGYTRDVESAGLFTLEDANKIANDDIDNLTLVVTPEMKKKILGL